MAFLEGPVAGFNEQATVIGEILKAGDDGYLREFLADSIADGSRDDCIRRGPARVFAVEHDPVDTIAVRLKIIIAELAVDEEHDQSADCHARRQSQDVDEGVPLSFN